ncbi:PKD domain-containing protein [Aquimarina longa]|uniref:PKD domain-containing protein n=1 Tax=Aquimarina longa TaxID=1080221 RepID=UPI0007811AF6|nr:hypothetical protein [Aquimarina longa]
MKKTCNKLSQLLSVIVLLGVFVLTGCSSDDSNSEGNTLTANAGPDQIVQQIKKVQLDGTGSKDSSGQTFKYLWEFSTVPTSSTSTLTNATTVSPSFTPDVVGEYVVQLTISNAVSKSIDTVKIKVTESGVVELEGVIEEDIVLKNLVDTPGVADYCVNSNVDLRAVMTIEPGVEIHFAADVLLEIGDKGVLIAKGTQDKHIVFTAKDQSKPWRGIGFVLSDDVRNVMDYVDVSYAGSDIVSIVDRKAGLGLSSFSKLSFTNSSVTHSSAIGMFVENNVELIAFANNRFENNTERPLVLPASEVGKLDAASQFSLSNGDNSIEIHDGSVQLDEPTTWQSFNDKTPYYVTDNIKVDSELNIMPGAVLMFDADKSLTVDDLGILIAKGAADNLIRFTAKDQSKPWRGIGIILSKSVRNALDYVEIAYAGLDKFSVLDEKSALGVSSFSKLSFTNSKIVNSVSNGMLIEENVELQGFSNNIFENNASTPLIVSADSMHKLDAKSQFGTSNGNDYVEILGDDIDFDTDITWNAFDDATPYMLSGDLDFQSGAIIAPKAKFLIKSDVEIAVSNSGFLSIKGGSAAGRIIFTAFDTTLPWRGIAFMTNNVRNEVDYVEVSYAGSDLISNFSKKANIGVNAFDKVKITNTIVKNGVGYGILVEKNAETNADIETSNTFTNNTLGTVFFEN